jgi:hypothetical protein
VRRRGGLDEPEIDKFLQCTRQAAPGRAGCLLEFLAACVLDFAQGSHDLCSQAVAREFRKRRRLMAGGKVCTEPVWPFVARLGGTQQAKRHKIGQFLARRAGGEAQPPKDSLVYIVTGAGEGYGGYLDVGKARDVHVLA